MSSNRRLRQRQRRRQRVDGVPADVVSSHSAAPGEVVVEPDPDPDPLEAVEAPIVDTVSRWRARLADLAGGSALRDIDSLGDALVDLTAAHPGGVAQLFAGRRTKLSNLAREGSALTQARRQARIVGARTDELAHRYGFAPTYVAIGVATWLVPPTSGPGDDEPAAQPELVRIPVLLRPVTITVDPADAEVYLELKPDVEINPELVRALAEQGIDLDPAALVDATRTPHGFTPAPALVQIEQLTAAIPAQIEPSTVLGAFVHPGQALAEDLDPVRLAQHPVVAALASSEGDAGLKSPLPARQWSDPDPQSEPGVGDLDAGQHRVLDAVAGGAHLLIDAPPGVDVPGTIAALVAQAAATGQRVLYVPGTKRAGEALLDSMRATGIERLALDLGTNPGWRDNAARHLTEGLDAPQREPEDTDQMRQQLTQARTTLTDFISALHTARPPWDTSAYRAMQELAELTSARPGPRTQAQLDPAAMQLNESQRELAREELARAAALGAFQLRAADTPWFGTVLTDAEHATATLDRVRHLNDLLPRLRDQVRATAAQTGLDEAANLSQWSEQLELLEGIRASLDLFLPAVFERSAADMAAACASRAWRTENGVSLSWGARRRLRKQARDLLRPGVPVTDLHAELTMVQARREEWRRHCAGGGWPQLPDGMVQILATEDEVLADIEPLQPVLVESMNVTDLREVPLADLEERIGRLSDDDAALRQMPERAGLLGALSRLGLGPLVQDLIARRVPTAMVGAEFDLAWWSSMLEELLRNDPALAGLDAESLDRAAAQLRTLDLQHTASLSAPIMDQVSAHIRAAIAADKPTAQAFYRAVRGGATDLKELHRQFGAIVAAPRPVWIVPPMLVPQVLAPEQQIDLVILDAVQHLPIEQAIAAISRGAQVVIVGDTRRGGGELIEAAARLLPSVELPGDRLDLDAEIAGFLADHGYGDVIRPVPAPPRASRISMELLDGTGMPGLGGQAVESVQVEVDRVVDLVIDHALTNPDSSLAVIALNTHHADRVREGVLSTAAGASMAAFFDPNRPEPFTVVDIESVAGLRRDAIILTVGYGKTPHGRVLYRFGAMSGPHGVAYTVDALDACRHRLTVVSCLAGEDLDPERLRTPGAVALRDLLLFANTGMTSVSAQSGELEPDRLLWDLSERLRRLGLIVMPRYGPVGGVRLPLAIGHPDLPGELFLALLTDDADYVAEPSLRRRDRHWVQRLENRGWRVKMVFSTAVFMDPQGEANKIKALVDDIVADRQQSRQGAVPVLAPPELVEPDVHEPEVIAPAGAGPDSDDAADEPASTGAEEPELDTSDPNGAGPTGAGPNGAGPNGTEPEHAESGHAEPERAESERAESEHAESEHAESESAEPEPGKLESDGPEPGEGGSGGLDPDKPLDPNKPLDPDRSEVSGQDEPLFTLAAAKGRPDGDRKPPRKPRRRRRSGPRHRAEWQFAGAAAASAAADEPGTASSPEGESSDDPASSGDAAPPRGETGTADTQQGGDSDQPQTRARPAPRRAVRQGTEQSSDGTRAWEDDDRAWGVTDDNDDRLLREVPPHWA
ncbi:MAG: hypothetical protein ACK5H2_09645 [Beutenbergiaceae bacterium]